MTTFKEKEKQRREQEILAQAKQLISSRGYSQLTMDDLAEAVGISKPTLYQHFKSKEELAAQVYIQDHADFNRHFLSLPDLSPLQQIIHMMRIMMKRRYEADSLMAQLGPEMFNIMRNSPVLCEMRNNTMSQFYDLVDAAKAQGEINIPTPTPIIAGAMFGMQASLGGHFGLPSAYTPDTLDESIEHVVQLFLNGVQGREKLASTTE